MIFKNGSKNRSGNSNQTLEKKRAVIIEDSLAMFVDVLDRDGTGPK